MVVILTFCVSLSPYNQDSPLCLPLALQVLPKQKSPFFLSSRQKSRLLAHLPFYCLIPPIPRDLTGFEVFWHLGQEFELPQQGFPDVFSCLMWIFFIRRPNPEPFVKVESHVDLYLAFSWKRWVVCRKVLVPVIIIKYNYVIITCLYIIMQ